MKILILLVCLLTLFQGLTSENNHHYFSQYNDEASIDTTDLSVRFLHSEPYVASDHLVGYWPMDEGSGYEFRDYSNVANTAYVFGTTWNTHDSGLTSSFRRKGKRGGAVFLNGTQWLQAKNNVAYKLKNFSLTAWVKLDELIAKTTLISLGAKQFELTALDIGSICLTFYDSKGNAKSYCTDKNTLAANSWTQITCSADISKSQVQIFVNGELAKKITTQPLLVGEQISDLSIGGMEANNGIHGLIDEVAIFNKPLSDQEARQLYYNGFPKTYLQTRETIDTSMMVWNNFKGNQHVPHFPDTKTIFLINFNGTLLSENGMKPLLVNVKERFQPGIFSGAYVADVASNELLYASPIKGEEGTFQSWIIPDNRVSSTDTERVLFKATGNQHEVKLFYHHDQWNILVSSNGVKALLLNSDSLEMKTSQPIHVAFTWKKLGERTEFVLYVNGVEQSIKSVAGNFLFNDKIQIGGLSNTTINALIDDVEISSIVKDWKAICPRGHLDTESAPLDLMDGFNHDRTEQLFHWKSLTKTGAWRYDVKAWEDDGRSSGNDGERSRCLTQRNPTGINILVHPDAYGYLSSIEAGVSFDKIVNGWAGVITKGSNTIDPVSGNAFMINPDKNEIRLAVFVNGKIAIEKVLPYDFKLKPHATYTLTLTCVDNVLRGYMDGHNMISLKYDKQTKHGFSGLITENAQACFDDVHFSALTSSVKKSRLIEKRVAFDGTWMDFTPKVNSITLNAFRWKKRYGALPWQRLNKSPEVAGNIFGPATDVVQRPNAVAYWRSEDDANSDILTVDGTMYYFMRCNPDFNGPHGVASIGALLRDAEVFDGIHFTDQNAGVTDLEKANLLRGHADNSYCPDKPPRNNRFQVNDEGAVYVDKKIIVLAREFKNSFSFRRLVYGVYDVATQKWQQREPYTVSWSHMNPDSCYSKISGFDATPEVCALRDPETDKSVIFLYHVKFTTNGIATTGVVGLTYQANTLTLNTKYPAKDTFTKHNQDVVYGERIFFDNGIYYMHVNAGSDKTKLQKDWPDRLQLFTSLHPYYGPWSASAENENLTRPYFTRGGEFDPDNAAIWQGTMFKHRNRYYMYYENFHSIGDVNNPYDQYDEAHSGSRVGFATAN